MAQGQKTMAEMTMDDHRSPLAVKLQDIYKRGYAKKKEARPAKPRGPRAKPDALVKGEHLDLNAPLKGVLGKGDDYAKRGSAYIKSKDGRGVYRNFNHPHLVGIIDMVRERAEFPGGPAWNFNPDCQTRETTSSTWKKAGQKHPYDWQAHHMLPGSSFYYVFPDGKPAFTYRQIRAILMSDYNINHGHNLINLPGRGNAWACPVHTLIQHPSDHPKYTKYVMSELRKISQRLQKLEDQLKPHDELVAKVFEDLVDIEEKMWKFLVKLSKAVVYAMAAENPPVQHNLVTYQTDSGTTYDYGALT